MTIVGYRPLLNFYVFFCVVPTNGTAQPMAPTGFNMGTLRLGSPWVHVSSAVVNGADIFTRPLNLQFPFAGLIY